MEWRVVLAAVLAAGIVGAQEPRATLMRGMGAAKILERAYRYLEEQKAFSLEAVTVNEDIYRQRMVTEVRHRIRLDLRRPGEMRVRIDGDSRHRDYLLREGTFLVWDRDDNLYGELKSPKTVDGTLDFLYDAYGIATPLANLLYSDLHRRLNPKARGYYFGIRELEGVRCHYLGFENAVKELQVWIQAEGEPLIRRFVIIDKSTRFRLHSATTIRWLSVGGVTGDPFAFSLPGEARKIPIEPAK
jgi:hypothetical protein